MKRLIAINVLAATLLINPANVLAIDSASNPADLRKQIQEEKSLERQAKLEQKIASNAARLEQMAQKKEQAIASKEARLEEKIAQTRAKIASREAQFNEKIAKFRDKQKADLASKINLNLNLINQNRTNAMTNNLNAMTNILEKLQNRVNELGANGVAVTAANAAIQEALTSVNNAKTAVTTQSEQDYNIVITTESKIGDDAKTTRDKLITDLKTTYEQVQSARQAVVNAIKVAVSLVGGQNGTN